MSVFSDTSIQARPVSPKLSVLLPGRRKQWKGRRPTPLLSVPMHLIKIPKVKNVELLSISDFPPSPSTCPNICRTVLSNSSKSLWSTVQDMPRWSGRSSEVELGDPIGGDDLVYSRCTNHRFDAPGDRHHQRRPNANSGMFDHRRDHLWPNARCSE